MAFTLLFAVGVALLLFTAGLTLFANDFGVVAVFAFFAGGLESESESESDELDDDDELAAAFGNLLAGTGFGGMASFTGVALATGCFETDLGADFSACFGVAALIAAAPLTGSLAAATLVDASSDDESDESEDDEELAGGFFESTLVFMMNIGLLSTL